MTQRLRPNSSTGPTPEREGRKSVARVLLLTLAIVFLIWAADSPGIAKVTMPRGHWERVGLACLLEEIPRRSENIVLWWEDCEPTWARSFRYGSHPNATDLLSNAIRQRLDPAVGGYAPSGPSIVRDATSLRHVPGDTVAVDGIRYVVTAVRDRREKKEYVDADTVRRVAVNLLVIADEDRAFFDASDARLLDSEGYQYKPTFFAREEPAWEGVGGEVVRRGEPRRGWVTFEVQQAATGLTLALMDTRVALNVSGTTSTPGAQARTRDSVNRAARALEAMKRDLLTLMKVEGEYQEDHPSEIGGSTYTSDLDTLRKLGFRPSEGVHIAVSAGVLSDGLNYGWCAVARADNSDMECAFVVGLVPDGWEEDARQGNIACRRRQL